VQVPCSEGKANHTGPESCAVHREVLGEALTGVRAGQPLSRERDFNPGADVVRFTEGNTAARAIASARPTRSGRRTWHARSLLGNREISILTAGACPGLAASIGKARSRSR
jgi:hypothetical protein